MSVGTVQPRRGDRLLDQGLAEYLRQVVDEELARRAEIATVTVLPKQLPVGPLVVLVEGRGGLYACLGRSTGQQVARLDIAYRRACDRGYLSWWMADRLAIEVLGLHPLEVWGGDWLETCRPPLGATSIPS